MSKKKITGVLVDVWNRTAGTRTIEKSLNGYYAALDCGCIDVVSRRIGGRAFDIICDDEGLLIDNPKISAISPAGNAELVGNLFIVKRRNDGNERSLTEKEIAHVLENVSLVRTEKHPSLYYVVCNVTY